MSVSSPGSLADQASRDRGADVTRAFLELVTERGFHGASMSLVARRARVANGTIYVHHRSKDDLVLTVYRQIKDDLGHAAVAGVDPTKPPRERFLVLWNNVLEHLQADPVRAQFLVQVDVSPFAVRAHESVTAEEDPLYAAAAVPDMAAELVDLPSVVLYDLAFGPAVRLAASGEPTTQETRRRLANSCWRAVTS